MGKEDNHLKINYNTISRNGDIYIFNESTERGISLYKVNNSILSGDTVCPDYLSISPATCAPIGTVPIEIGTAEYPFYNINVENITIPHNWLLHRNVDDQNYAYISNIVPMGYGNKKYTYRGLLDAYTHSEITESDLVCYDHPEWDNVFKYSIYDIRSFNFNYLLLSENEKDFVVSLRDNFDNYVVDNFFLRGEGKWEMTLSDENYFYLLNSTGKSYPIGLHTQYNEYIKIAKSSLSSSIDKPCTDLLFGRDTTSATARIYLGVYNYNLVSIRYGIGLTNYLLEEGYLIKFKDLSGETKVLYSKDNLYVYPLLGSDCFFLYYKGVIDSGTIITSVCKPLYYYENDKDFGFMIEEAISYNICQRSKLEYRDNLHEFTIEDLSNIDTLKIVPIDESNIVVSHKDKEQKNVVFTYTTDNYGNDYIENYCYDNPAAATYGLSLEGSTSVIDIRFRYLFKIQADISILTPSPCIGISLVPDQYIFDNGFTTIKRKDRFGYNCYPGLNKYMPMH